MWSDSIMFGELALELACEESCLTFLTKTNIGLIVFPSSTMYLNIAKQLPQKDRSAYRQQWKIKLCGRSQIITSLHLGIISLA